MDRTTTPDTAAGPATSLRRALLARYEAYCARTGTAPTTLARRILKASASLFDRLRRDSDMRLTTLDRVAAKLDELEAALPPGNGDPDGEETEQEPAQGERPCGEGRAVHQAD